MKTNGLAFPVPTKADGKTQRQPSHGTSTPPKSMSNGSEWIVDNEIPEPKRVPPEATPLQLVFLLSSDPSAPVDVELQDGLNRLSFF